MNTLENRSADIAGGWKGMSVRRRLTLAMALLMGVSITVFAVFLYSKQQQALMDGVDAKLETAARMAQANLPANYHDRIAGPGSISDQEYQGIVDRFNRLCKSLGLEYLWSVMPLDGRIVFTSATSPDKEVGNRKHAAFLEVHSNPGLYTDALRSKTKTVQINEDRWGSLRVVLIPYQDQRGRPYLMGAGMRLSEVDRALNDLVLECAVGGVFLFLVSVAGIYLLAGLLSRPVERLTETIKAIAAGDFTRQAPEDGAREHVQLARCFNQLNQADRCHIQELTLERENLRITLQSIGDGVIVTDAAGRVARMNPVAERLTGWPFADAAGRPLLEVFRIVNAQSRQLADDPVARVLKTGLVVGLANHTALIARDGTERQIADSAAPIRDANARILGAVMVFSDVTEAYAMQKAVREAEERFHLLFERMIGGAALHEIICDTSGKPVDYRFLEVNPAFEQLTGFKAADVLGRTVREVMPKVEPDWIERYGRVALTGASDRFDHYAAELDRHFSVAAYSPKPGQFAVVFQDITSAKRAEAALMESEARYKSYFEESQAIMLLIDPDTGAIEEANAAAVDFYGWTKAELCAKNIADINTLPWGDIKAQLALGNSEKRKHHFFKHRRACGDIRDVEVYNGPIKVEGKTLFKSIVQDITERKQAELKLERSRAELKAVYDQAPLLMCVVGRSCEVLYGNRAFTEFAGQSGETMRPETPGAVLRCIHAIEDPRGCGYGHNCESCALRLAMKETFETGCSQEAIEYRTTYQRAGIMQEMVMLASTSLIETGEQPVLLLCLEDVTDRSRADQALRESEARFRSFYELGLIGMWISTLDKGFSQFNDRLCEILGWSRQELPVKSWSEMTHPEDLPADVALFEQVLSGVREGYSMDKRFIRKNGEVVYTSMSVRCVRNPDGSPNHFVGMMQDISDRKRSEEVMSGSLREKEALLKEVHHRVKNNLQIVSSLLRLQAAQIDHPMVAAALRDMRNRIRTMALLHENLYRSENLAQVNLAEYLQGVCAQLLRSMVSQPGLVRLEMNIAAVSLDVGQAVPCGLLINELVSNSLKHAFPQGRSGVVRVELQPVPEERSLRLRVSDDGAGLPPGFDLHAVHSLGLQLVADLARQLHGILVAWSDNGAVFEVVFEPISNYTMATANE